MCDEEDAVCDDESMHNVDTLRSSTRQRIPTLRGREYQSDMKVKYFKSKRSELCQQMKLTLMLRGKCEDVSKWKQELSKAQIIQMDLSDTYFSIIELFGGKEPENIQRLWDQVLCEWSNFQDDVKTEIRYVEQLYLDQTKSQYGSRKSACSVKSSRHSNKGFSSKRTLTTLQHKEAALKVELAFLSEEQKLDRERLQQEQKEENLRLQKELAQHHVQLSVCAEISNNERDESILADLPRESHTESVMRYFDSISPEFEAPNTSKPPVVEPLPTSALSQEAATIQVDTQLHANITTATPLISPAHFTVTTSKSSQSKHRNNNIAASLCPPRVQPSLSHGPTSNDTYVIPTSKSHMMPGYQSATQVNSSHSNPANDIYQGKVTTPFTMHPFQHSTPLFTTHQVVPTCISSQATHTSSPLPETRTMPSVHTPVPSPPSHSEPSTQLKQSTPLFNQFVNCEELPRVQAMSESGLEKVATSLEHCVTKLIESSEKIALTNVSQSKSRKSGNGVFHLPSVKIPVFNGDPLEYPVWNSTFKALVDSREMDADTKLNLLNQYVSGSPKQVVEHYLLIGTEDAYAKAKSVLQERYGNPNVVSSAFLNKLEKWSKIGPRDSEGLREFSDFLDKVVAARKHIPSLAILDFAKENVKLIAKLPYQVEGKWRDEISVFRKANGEATFPPFPRFADFVRSAADKANIPELDDLSKLNNSSRPIRSAGARAHTLATEAMDRHHPRKKTSDHDNHAAGRFPNKEQNNQVSKPGRNVKLESATEETQQLCLFCSKEHFLNNCKAFQEKPFSVRKTFFFSKRLCLGCAQGNHQIKDCKNKPHCKQCGEDHLTCLHQDIKANTYCTNVYGSKQSCSGVSSSMIVPVWVRSVHNPTKEILQYAILDDQSNLSFVSQRLCNRLHLKGPPTKLNLTTMQESNVLVDSTKIKDIEVLDYNKEHLIKLPPLFTREMPVSSSQIARPEVVRNYTHLKEIADELIPHQVNVEVSILIGNDCPRAIRPREICAGGEEDPYAQKTLLAWGVVGRTCKSIPDAEGDVSHMRSTFVASTQVKEVLVTDVLKVLETDFQESNTKAKALSVEDRRFLQLLEDGICKLENGHYQMPLPLKTNNVSLPYNRPLAEKRWRQLQARFKKNPKFLADYKEFMEDVVKTCAEKVPPDRLGVRDGKINYVPHTGVYHPKKPGRIRIVCSARFDGVSINDCLLQGLDLTNGLLGVLCRFREERTAFMMDVKGMFHQFFVPEHHRDLLRFLWWEDGDETKAVIEYRMRVHLFGASSSPGCANFGLKRAADDGEKDYGADAASFIRQNFYVDDGLKSTATASEAINLIESSKAICSKAGLHLHKITSNSKEVLQAVPVEDRSNNTKNINLIADTLPIERALGVVWCVEDDSFRFRIELKDQPCTRRGVLSTVCSIYDPHGYVAPVTLKGKQILQQMCRDKLDWDSPVPDPLRPLWERWRTEVMELQRLKVPRCFKGEGFESIKAVELHSFSDASQDGYGQCSYLRLLNEENRAHCSFVVGKARVTPLKQSTIPRLELVAATTSAKMSKFLRTELTYQDMVEYFHTDSQVVLGYVKNEARRFHLFVANRVQQIRELSDPNAWIYVDTHQNPADDASRGLTARQLLDGSRWLTGPEFLWKDGPFNAESRVAHRLDEADPEVKKGVVLSSKAHKVQDCLNVSRLSHLSSWFKLKKAIARCLQWMDKLRRQQSKNGAKKPSSSQVSTYQMTPALIHRAEKTIIRCVQAQYFMEEIQALRRIDDSDGKGRMAEKKRKSELKTTSSIYKLDPYLDQDGLIRVGGRLENAHLPSEVRHPVLLPRKCHVTTLLIRHYHAKVNHMGRTTTHNELRQRGFWIVSGSSAVSNVISECVTCRRQRRAVEEQKMSSLPKDRMEQVPPFSYCAVDYFGPYIIKERRSEVKRYGVLFTCLASRGVHLETANSLDTSSFIQALRRFLARRGPVRQIRCDQGTNFIGARNELKAAIDEMDEARVSEYLLSDHDCEWIPFKFNTPHSSHMGGSWERLIGTVRRALEPMLRNHGKQLDDESLRTLMTEVENIVNSRPLTSDNLCDSDAPEPLTPSHLLTMKPKLLMPPPGDFQHADVYSRHRWRRVQYLINLFWTRWRKEFIQILQIRPKWNKPRREISVGDVVIIKDGDLARNKWPLAKVVETWPSEDGLVRKVKVLVADGALNHEGKRTRPSTYLNRPVQKLVVLLPVED